MSWDKIILGLVLVVVLSNLTFDMQTHHVYAQQTSPVSPQIQQRIVPEFGPLTGMIIAISIIGVLTISRKFRFHF